MDLSLIRKRNSTYSISKYEMQQFAYLLKSGLDISTVIQLSFQDSEQIIQELKKGMTLSDALFQYETSTYFSYVSLCAKHIALPEAIECAFQLDRVGTGLAADLMKRLIYPIFLFLFAYLLVVLFSDTIIPSMAVYAPNNPMMLAVDILKVTYTLIFLGTVYFVIICRVKDRSRIYRNYIRKVQWIRKRNTLEFSILWDAMMQAGMSSHECFRSMAALSCHGSIASMSSFVDQQLMDGVPLSDVFRDLMYFDDLFVQYVEVGMQTSNISQLLRLYQDKTEKDLEQMMRRLGHRIQLFSYVSVGALVFVFYQVMLLPLNMLTTF